MADGQRPRYTRRDANQQEIMDDLRGLGFYVLDLADVGGQALDIFVCGRVLGSDKWRWLAVEIKTSAGRLTAKQRQFFEMWPDAPAIVAQATEDVLRWYAHERMRVQRDVCNEGCDAYESCGGPTLCLKDEEAECS